MQKKRIIRGSVFAKSKVPVLLGAFSRVQGQTGNQEFLIREFLQSYVGLSAERFDLSELRSPQLVGPRRGRVFLHDDDFGRRV